MLRTTRAVDPALLPHDRPCWCEACKRTYRAIYYRRNSDRWSAEYAATARKKYLNQYEGKSVAISYATCAARDCSRCWIVRPGVQTKKKFCSRQCRQREQYRQRHPICRKVCPWCLTEFESGAGASHKSDATYCSNKCSQSHLRHYELHRHPNLCHLPVCIDCHRMTGKPIQYRRCEDCTESNRKKSRPASDAKKNANRRRRDAVRTGELFTVDDLIERDGPKCTYPGCNRDVLTNLHPNDVDYATIDHVVPLSEGGEHTMANAQVMHRSCNAKKGARALDDSEQLRSV